MVADEIPSCNNSLPEDTTESTLHNDMRQDQNFDELQTPEEPSTSAPTSKEVVMEVSDAPAETHQEISEHDGAKVGSKEISDDKSLPNDTAESAVCKDIGHQDQ